MIKIDYNLEIIGEKKIYHPREEFIKPIEKSEKRIFEITADNSYGKTFILNLLAYALDADKLSNEQILPIIKESVSRYDDFDAYKLSYNLDLLLPDNNLLSLSKEPNHDKKIQLNGGSPINYRKLHQDLSIIYDVPINPSERLNGVIKDLGKWNENLIKRFYHAARFLEDITKDFDSVRDEEKIKQLQGEIRDITVSIQTKKTSIKSNKDIWKQLLCLKNLNNLSSLFKNKFEIEKLIAEKRKQFVTLKKPAQVQKRDESKIKLLNEEIASINSKFRNIIGQLITEINSDSEIRELITNDNTNNANYNWIKDTNLIDILSQDDYVKYQNKFVSSLEFVRDEIVRFIEEKKNAKSYIIHNTYKQFIDLLEDLMEKEIDYLLQDVITLNSQKLKKQLEELVDNHKVKSYDELKTFLKNDLKPINGLIAQYMKTSRYLETEKQKKNLVNDDSLYYKVQGELTELQNQLKDKKLLENINQSMSKLERIIKIDEGLLESLEKSQRLNNMMFEMEDKKNPSKYNDKQKLRIRKFIRMLRLVNANLSSYNDLISHIDKGNLEKFKTADDIKFIELAGIIIAYSMDNKLLRADGVYLNLNFYDMLKQEFHCEGDLIIKKADVATGLASATYLKQRIENVEGKYVVILLDEIGNMAQSALNTVIAAIKKIEQQNRLTLAIFTRPNSEGIKIIEY